MRRIPPKQVARDTSPLRPASSNFENSPDGTGTSVDIWEADCGPENTLAGHPGFGLVVLTVQDVREQGVIRWPVPGNQHHALLQGKKTQGVRRRLAERAAHGWYKYPEPPY